MLTNSLLVSACNGLLLHRLVTRMRTVQPWHGMRFDYFWWMRLFEKELQVDLNFRHTWQMQVKSFAAIVHQFQPVSKRMCAVVDDAAKVIAQLKSSPTHKLSHHFVFSKCKEPPAGKMNVYDYFIKGHALQAMLRENASNFNPRRRQLR